MRIVVAVGGNTLLRCSDPIAPLPGIVAGTAGTNVVAQPA